MSKNLINNLTKYLVDTLTAIEISDDTTINDDIAVRILEQISAEFQELSEIDKHLLVKKITQLSLQYPKGHRQLNFGM